MNNNGFVYYQILTDQTGTKLYISITDNDRSGSHSSRPISFSQIEKCIEHIQPDEPFSSKIFCNAFGNQYDNNNAGFLAAILRAEKLLEPSDDNIRQHLIQPDWSKWKTDKLRLKQPFIKPASF